MRHLGAVALLFAVGCGDTPLPVQPTPSVAVPTLPEFGVSGTVNDTAMRPIGGSRVEIIAGASVGTVATTNDAGRFLLPGSFTGVITITASKDGYVPETRTIPPARAFALPPDPGSRFDMWFELAPAAASANLAGTYTLTLTADQACTKLPEEARTRSYTATIAPGSRSTSFNGTLSDARFLSLPCLGRPQDSCIYNQFGIGMAGDFANIGLGIVEQLGETAYLVIEGGVAGTFGPSGITTPIDANFLYCPTRPEWTTGEYWACPAKDGAQGVECYSRGHQLTLVRR